MGTHLHATFHPHCFRCILAREESAWTQESLDDEGDE